MKEYERYYDLLQAITNSDQEEKNHRYGVICVYDTFDNDRLVAIFNNAKTCGDFFGTNENVISCNMSRKQLKSGRYRLERVEL